MSDREGPEFPSVDHLQKTWQAAVLLLAGMIVTVLAANYIRTATNAADKREFEFAYGELKNSIADRLQAHERVLRSGAAFLESRAGVTREEWHRFSTRHELAYQLPGIQGSGFSLIIPRQQLAQHIQEIRAEGFPAYTVWPAGTRETYTAIVYIEPFTGRNLRAFGYDMYTETVRREAMERARDHNAAALSGKVLLVQETDKAIQAGTLMYVPVYRTGMPVDTVAQRRAAILGWSYSPYRMDDLMRGILAKEGQDIRQQLHLEVYDGETTSPETLLYDSRAAGDEPAGTDPRLTGQSRIMSAGRPWTLRFASMQNPAFAADYSKAWLALFSGTSISLLLSGLFLNLSTTRARASQMARQLTAELRQKTTEANDQRWRLANILEGTHVGTWEWNVQTGGVIVNETWAQLIGYSLDELAPISIKTWEEHTHTDDLKRSAELLERHFAGEVPYYESECRMKHKDGRWVWVLDRGRVMTRTEDGKPLMMFGTHADIADRKRLEEMLRSSEASLNRAQSVAHIGSWDLDIEENKLLWSNECYRIFQIPLGTRMTYERFLEQVLPDDQAAVNGAWAAALEGKPYDVVHRILVDGKVKWIQELAVVEYSADGRALRAFGTVQDITERKQTETALSSQASRYEALLHANRDGVHVLDARGDVVEANAAFCEMLGYTRDAMLKLNVADWDAQWSRAELLERIHEFIAHPGLFETRHRRKDGTVIDVEISGVGINLNGRDHLHVSARDITDRKRTSEALVRMQKLESLGSLAGGIAHDFNNLLTAILGNVSLLSSRTMGDTQAQTLIKEAQDACNTATGIARQLVTFAKGGSPVVTIQDLRPMLAQSATFAARGSHSRCVFDLGDSPLTGNIDSGQIAQVVHNLILNAVQAVPEGGDISIRASCVTLDENERSTLAAGRYVQVSVSDQGSGIAPDILPRIFDPYFSTKATGRGLGLAVCHSIMARHGGLIAAESKPGTGSVLTLSLPAVEAEDRLPAPNGPSSTAGSAGVLIMDDEALVSMVLRRILVSLGYRAECVADGQAALDAYEAAMASGRPYDLVIMDLTIPGGMGGMEAIRKLKAIDPKAKAIVSSGYADNAVMTEYAAHGFLAVLAKPYRIEDVAETLRVAIASGGDVWETAGT